MRKSAPGSGVFVRYRTDGREPMDIGFSSYFLIFSTRNQEVERFAMSTRRRFKQVTSFKDRLAQEAESLRRQAQEMPPGVPQEKILRKARQAETAARIEEWLASPGLQPPK
jgi:hypothetical protein